MIGVKGIASSGAIRMVELPGRASADVRGQRVSVCGMRRKHLPAIRVCTARYYAIALLERPVGLYRCTDDRNVWRYLAASRASSNDASCAA